MDEFHDTASLPEPLRAQTSRNSLEKLKNLDQPKEEFFQIELVEAISRIKNKQKKKTFRTSKEQLQMKYDVRMLRCLCTMLKRKKMHCLNWLYYVYFEYLRAYLKRAILQCIDMVSFQLNLSL